MARVFDAWVMVDWSASAQPKTGRDSIWICCLEQGDGAPERTLLANPPTRDAAMRTIVDLATDFVARDRVALVGFDFAFGYPRGFARWLCGEGSDWRAVWRLLGDRIRDRDDNANNRFEVAAAINGEISGGAFPFWGCPAAAAGPNLSVHKPAGWGDELAEYRLCDRAARGPHSVWQLAYTGSVGSQTLLGVARLEALRRDPALAAHLRVWPFETGLVPLRRPGRGEWRLLLAEVYPSILPIVPEEGEVRDRAQVRTVVDHFAALDARGALAPLFGGPPWLDPEQRRTVESEEAWILGIETAAGARPAPEPAGLPEAEPTVGEPPHVGRPAPLRDYGYVRDPEEIYRRSFATIRAEADLSALPPDLEPLAVRLIHAAGDIGLVADLAWSDGAVTAGRAALGAGAPILVDTEMVAAGIIRARLPAANAVVCTLAEAGLADAARAAGTTRSAAAVDRWRDRLDGAVVVVGNAPTALFRLLELIDAGAPHPAVILGFPVGFVGAAESKAALIAHPAGVPFVSLRGRRGGSALAAAALNALAGAPS